MLTIPVYNPAGEQIGEESIDPADFGGEINKQLLHDVVLMHLAARRVGHGQHPRPGRRRRLGQEALPPEGDRQRPRRRQADATSGRAAASAFARRNRDYRYAMPKKAVRTAIRMALLSKFQDGQALVLDGLALNQPKTKRGRQGPPGDPPARPERGRGHRGRRRDQDPGPQADPRAALDPARPARPRPGHAPQRPQHRRRQGRPGGRVQHLRYPQAALPGADPRGAGDPQGTGQAQAGPPPRPTARPAATRCGRAYARPPPPES